MTELELKINSKIEINFNNEGYKSIIQDVREDCFAITVPIKNGSYMPMLKGEVVSASYYSGKELYGFESEVLGRTIDRIFLILLSLPRNLRVVQRRNFVRVALVKDINLIKIDDLKEEEFDKNDEGENLSFVRALLLDISGGGAKMKCKLDIKMHDILLVSIPVKNEELLLKAKVVRIENQEDKSCICGLDFIDISESNRDKIIKHIFEIMREQRSKGLKD